MQRIWGHHFSFELMEDQFMTSGEGGGVPTVAEPLLAAETSISSMYGRGECSLVTI